MFATINTADSKAPDDDSRTTFGSPDCAQWTREHRAEDRAWLRGYMSGRNRRSSRGDVLDKVHSAQEMFGWMDAYCKANPHDRVSLGADRLFLELIKRK